MTAVDNELDEPLAFVSGLSSSTSFARGDFASLEGRARDALSPYGYVIVIESADGKHEYVNTARPLGSENTGSAAAVPLHLGKPASGYLHRVEERGWH